MQVSALNPSPFIPFANIQTSQKEVSYGLTGSTGATGGQCVNHAATACLLPGVKDELPDISEFSNKQRIEPSNGQYQSGSPLWLISAYGRAIESFSVLAPTDAHIAAVGVHNFLPITAAAWISDQNEISVTVKGDTSQVGRSLLLRIWTRDRRAINRTVSFYLQGDHTIAVGEFGEWDGLPIAGVILLSLFLPEAKS